MRNIVSLSGGKDSVALWLWARRTGLDPVAVYIDTGWEWDGHFKHLDLLEQRLGKIHRCGPREGFEATTRRKGIFPSRVKKWCTEELKTTPFREWLLRFRDDTGDDVRVLLGIRREESSARADPLKTPEREWSKLYDCEVLRPILDWTVADVAAEHHRAGIPLHPLYHYGAERVGCWPCVNAPKAELALISELDPARVVRVRELETELGATMFTRDRRPEKEALLRAGASADEAGPSVEPIGIDEVMAWAKTKRGGKQLSLVRPRTGCARWGVCEAPREPDEKPPGRGAA